jgi:hypothetical protein
MMPVSTWSPPMVGVPALVWWACEAPRGLYCPTCSRRRRSIIHGPRMRTRKSAVRLATAVRKVM